MQPRITLKVSVLDSSPIHDKVIPVPNYIIPQTRSGDDSISRTIKRKTIQDISREIPAHTHPIYRPPPKPAEIPIQEIPRKLMDLANDINMDFKEIPLSRRCYIRNLSKAPSVIFPRTTRNGKSDYYRQASAKILTKAG